METEKVETLELFQMQRFPSGPSLFFLMFYVPIGLVLAVFRFFLSLHLLLVVSLLNKSWLITRILLRVCCTVLGIIVTSEGIENLDKNKSKVLISNHVTLIDNVAMEIVTPCIMRDKTSGSPWLIEKVLKYSNFGGSKEKENLNSRISQTLTESSVPLLVFPEETTTTGKKGLLKFNPWAFELTSTVIPASIVAERFPFPGISYSVLGSQWWSEVFWFLFVPYTHFHIRFLPPLSKREEQSTEDFSQDTQKAIAASLGIRTTNLTLEDKNIFQEELKQKTEILSQQTLQSKTPHNGTAASMANPPRENNASPGRETRLNKMAAQVKEVLPQVPLEAIKRDLGKTRCVDTTITNIIEGKVNYTPENSPSVSYSSKSMTPPSPPKASNAASSFSPSSEKRQQSFEERKRAMIEEARRRYIAKHGL